MLGKILLWTCRSTLASVASAGDIGALSSKNLIVRTSRFRSVSSLTRRLNCGFGELNVAARHRTLPNCLVEMVS